MKKNLIILPILVVTIGGLFFFERTHTPTDCFWVLPHHLVTSAMIGRAYDAIATNCSPRSIVIILPNHFSYGIKNHETRPNGFLCQSGICHPLRALSGVVVSQGDFRIFHESTQFISENVSHRTTKEHGITSHLGFVSRYWPDSPIFPFIIRPNTPNPSQLDDYTDILLSQNLPKPTLWIASVDMSHHIYKPYARLHDITTIDRMMHGVFDGIEVDCQNCLALWHRLAQYHGFLGLQWHARTSVAEIQSSSKPHDNTSHLFLEAYRGTSPVPLGGTNNDIQTYHYLKGSDQSPVISFLRYGDLMGARGIQERIASGVDFHRPLFQLSDTRRQHHRSVHRLWYGIDIVGANIEIAVVDTMACISGQKDQSLVFHTDPVWMHQWIAGGLTFAILGNNHTMDCGSSGWKATQMFFDNASIPHVGSHDNSHILWTGSIRGQEIAIISLNDFSS